MTIEALIDAVACRTPSGDADRRALAVHVADALVCLAKTMRLGEAQAIRRFYGEAKVPAAASIIRMSEYDAIHVPTCLSPDAVTVPAALSLARDADSLLEACEAGTAVGLWLADAVGGVTALERGIWPTLFAAPAMAAVSAGVAMRLGPDDLAHALAIALAGTSGRLGRPSGAPSARWLSIGEATLKGVRAAEAAAHGFRGDLGLVSAAWLRGQGAVGDAIPALPSGTSPLMRVGLKPYVAARQGVNALTAFLEAADGLDARSIDAVRIDLPSACLPVVTRPLDLSDRLSRIANLRLRIALAACEPGRLHDVEATVAPDEPALALAEHVEIHADDTLPAGADTAWPARVRVLVRGVWREATCLRGPGDDGNIAVAECVLGTKLGRLEDTQTARLLAGVQAALHEGRADALDEVRTAFDRIMGETQQERAVEERPRRLA
ncbi:MAG: MmgE/PrpD family protein [Rhizobiaceae bacterium]|nr:MmgE/PrpD family protein [Rhizobiaceae bacterium]